MQPIDEFLAGIKFDVNAPDGEAIGHHLRLDGAYYLLTAPRAYRVFNRSWTLGGRLFWWGQSLKKGRRLNALINGEPVAEPDFRQLHPTMLYLERSLIPPDDAYDVSDILPWATRDEGKLALNVLINGKGGKAGAVAALLRKRENCDARTGKPKWTRDASETREIVEAVRQRNAGISDDLGTCAGLRLMNQDSQIMLDTLKGCIKAGMIGQLHL